MQNVLVTGSTGFVGAYVLKILIEKGLNVAIIIRSNSDTWRVNKFLSSCLVLKSDLKNISSLNSKIKDFSPDCCIHLAWSGVFGSERNDEIQYQNYFSSIQLLQLCIDVGCKNFIGLGSQAEYGQMSGIISEKDKVNPTTLYGKTKLKTFRKLKEISELNNINFTWLRLFSTYGPLDNNNWLIPYTIKKFLLKDSPKLTKGEQIWDYLYVEDAANAIVQIAIEKKRGLFNLGSGNPIKLKDLIIIIKEKIDINLELKFGDIPYRDDQVMHLEADISKLKNVIEWIPKTSLDSGLEKTILWIRELN